ncbi:MAG: hypothetical protein FJ267_00090 [Planctomycetes bacterium]|nr:hypothetical protein [Planctomycetota bacterium]
MFDQPSEFHPNAEVTDRRSHNRESIQLARFRERQVVDSGRKGQRQNGSHLDIEVQLSVFSGLVQRLVYYGCELYAGQLEKGDDYRKLKPVFSICLVNGILWQDSQAVHHRFQLHDSATRRTLEETLEVHT